MKICIQIPAKENRQRDINELLTRPVGRSSHQPVVWYKGFSSKLPVGKWQDDC